jgi:hypothetical protein
MGEALTDYHELLADRSPNLATISPEARRVPGMIVTDPRIIRLAGTAAIAAVFRGVVFRGSPPLRRTS